MQQSILGWVVGAVTVAMVACSQPTADGAPEFPVGGEAISADLAVWPADEALRELVLAVAPRIERATGLVVKPTTDTNAGPPLFWSTIGDDEGWHGLTHVDWARRPEWLAIAPGTPVEIHETVALHELLHGLGADHVPSGEGVLSPELWTGRSWKITTADLTVICSVRDCQVFAPEAE